MGSLIGHVVPGFAFLLLGLWHLFNHIKLHSLHPKSYKSTTWFPSPKIKYLELFFIMLGSSISIAMELVIGPRKHHPFDSDGTIPSNHLHNFEHATISLTFFTYAAFTILLDRNCCKSQHALAHFLGAIAFTEEFLLFHLHSTDHMGLEGHYHFLLQLIILVSLTTTILGICLPKSFMVSFVRSASIFFQGVWLIMIGLMLWNPKYIPKGCFLHYEEGHQVVRCHKEEALHRAKSLVNIEFSWVLVGITIFLVFLYVVLEKHYGEQVEYGKVSGKDEYSDD
ncbi:transmembrane protein 45B-like [Pistacia vera]|uniref:transmembrane protein 45B-like n=1 Tax=Pistacia vera TaxID=55513 RepID=UPI00126308B1|nr:transmembrane protein 45B-like [Pistacia vera]